jgi:hypothetical protein
MKGFLYLLIVFLSIAGIVLGILLYKEKRKFTQYLSSFGLSCEVLPRPNRGDKSKVMVNIIMLFILHATKFYRKRLCLPNRQDLCGCCSRNKTIGLQSFFSFYLFVFSSPTIWELGKNKFI